MISANGKIDLGELFVCRIEHDNSGLKSGWHLEHINVIQGDKNWLFPCNQVYFILFSALETLRLQMQNYPPLPIVLGRSPSDQQ